MTNHDRNLGEPTAGQVSVFTEDNPFLDGVQKGLPVLGPLLDLTQRTFGLHENSAKTIIYYAIATHGLPVLAKFPILTLNGPYGTGKTTILEMLQLLVLNPIWVDGTSTKATLRDNLLSDTTALIDEADGVHEQLLVQRYARQSAIVQVKRQEEIGWRQSKANVFGATALHRRRPFRDAAVLSRSVMVMTRLVDGVPPFVEAEFARFALIVRSVAATIEWTNVNTDRGNRIEDTWEPLRAVGVKIGDLEWCDFALSMVEKAKKDLRLGQDEEPTEAVFRAVLALAVSDTWGNIIKEPSERILVGDIVKKLREDEQRLSSWQVGQIGRDLGFDVIKVGGNTYIYTGGTARLIEVGIRLGVEDVWLTDAATELATARKV